MNAKFRLVLFVTMALLAAAVATPLVISTLASNEGRAPELKGSGQYESVVARYFRYDFGGFSLAESEYTTAIGIPLGSDFYNLSDPTWWDRARAALEDHMRQERTIRKPELWDIKSLPSVEWLQKNAQRYARHAYMMEFVIPGGGVLQHTIDGDKYAHEALYYPKGDILAPMHVSWNGSQYYSYLNAIPEPGNLYGESPDIVRKAKDGKLLYRYADGKRYLIIQLSQEFLSQTESELDNRPFEEKIVTEILKAN